MAQGRLIYLDAFGASGGVGRVSRELIRVLARRLGGDFQVAGLPHAIDTLREACGAEGNGVSFQNLAPRRSSFARVAYELKKRSSGRNDGFTRFLRSRLPGGTGSADGARVLVNFPHLLHPPMQPWANAGVLIYDLNWRFFPQNFDDPERTDRWCAAWIRNTAVTFTISEFIRRQVIEAYHRNPELVIAAPLAPYRLTPPRLSLAGQDAWLDSIGVGQGPFYLYPAVHGAHKGFEVLATSLSKTRECHPVVVTCGDPERTQRNRGSIRDGELRELQMAFAQLGKDRKLIVLGHLPEDELEILRQRCRAFLLPSSYEGYGFGLVEAMAESKPVICTDIPAYTEIRQRYGKHIRASVFTTGSAEHLGTLLASDYHNECVFTSAEQASGSAPEWSWEETATVILDGMDVIPAACVSP